MKTHHNGFDMHHICFVAVINIPVLFYNLQFNCGEVYVPK